MTAYEWVTKPGWATAHAFGPGLGYGPNVTACGHPVSDRQPAREGMRRCGRCARSVGDSPAEIESGVAVEPCCVVVADMMRQRDEARTERDAVRAAATEALADARAEAARADLLSNSLEHAHARAQRLLHQYDTLTLALDKRWGSKKKERFVAKVEARHPWREPAPYTATGSS